MAATAGSGTSGSQDSPPPSDRPSSQARSSQADPAAVGVAGVTSPMVKTSPGPFGFLASMVFLAWTAAAGITFLVLGARQPRPHLAHAITVPAEEVRHA